jgi:hypothetical protein
MYNVRVFKDLRMEGATDDLVYGKVCFTIKEAVDYIYGLRENHFPFVPSYTKGELFNVLKGRVLDGKEFLLEFCYVDDHDIPLYGTVEIIELNN